MRGGFSLRRAGQGKKPDFLKKPDFFKKSGFFPRLRPAFPFLVLVIGFALLNWQLDAKSFWVDELFTANQAVQSPAQVVANVAADLHPPLYFIGIRTWAEVAGTSEFSLRWPSVAAATLGLVLVWQLGKTLGGSSMGLAAMAATGFSPLFVEFSRMARYYSWVLALGILATWLLVVALERNRTRYWVGYGASSVLLLYTFYPSAALILAHGAWLLLHPRRDRAYLFKWSPVMALAGGALAPWALFFRNQISQAGQVTHADFAASPAGLVLSLLWPTYAFTVGETLYPWSLLGIFTFGATLALILWGVRQMSTEARGVTLAIVVLGIFLTAVVTNYISTGTPFLKVPPRALFVLPYVALLMGAGWAGVRRRVWKIGLTAVVGIGWAVALANGYTSQQFLNPNYVIPAREVASEIAARTGPSDVVIGEWDSGFPYYFHQMHGRARYFEATDPAALDYLKSHSVDSVWVAYIGRDRTREATPVDLINWLNGNKQLLTEDGYVEQDAVYRALKQALLRRPAYRFKLVVLGYLTERRFASVR